MTSPTKPFRSLFPDVPIPNVPLTEFVLGAARARGNKAALVCAATNRTLTYRELVAEVQRLAAGLSQHGIAKGDVVGIWSPNSPEYAVVFHAVISLGAIL